MNVTNDAQLDWSSEDQLQWREFLKTRAGTRLIPKALENAPTLLAKGETNELMIRAGELRGWSECLRVLLGLTAPIPVPTSEPNNYPDLTDDAAWSDGRSTQPK